MRLSSVLILAACVSQACSKPRSRFEAAPAQADKTQIGTQKVFDVTFELDGSKDGMKDPERKHGRRRVAVVGAGSAGLAALKALKEVSASKGQEWDVVAFEEREDVGGIWLEDTNDPHPPELPRTPLYPSLKTNTPHPTMTYPNFTFHPGTPIFPTHEYVEQYHRHFASHFNLTELIQFETSVESVEWIGNGTNGVWNVTIMKSYSRSPSRYKAGKLRGGETRSETFDHVIVANGHNHYPTIPRWPGQDEWLEVKAEREITHSIFWRNGTKYEGKNVVVVGGGASGRDIVLHTATHCRKVYLSLRNSAPPRRLDAPFTLKPGISHFNSTHVCFTDDTSLPDIDAVILGTGYRFIIPFLSSTSDSPLWVSPSANSSSTNPSRLTTNNKYIFPLHEHVFSLSSQHPPNSLSFIGLPILISNCPSDYAQALLIAHAIYNSSLLPSREEMLRSLHSKEDHMRERGFNPYQVGHRLIDVNGPQAPNDPSLPTHDTSHDYQDSLVAFLKSSGALPDDGVPYVEEWRRWARLHSEELWRAWGKVEGLGKKEVHKWVDGVETEAEWVQVMKRLVEWDQEEVQF